VTGAQKGMTLLELMLVLACFGILTAIAVPYWVASGRPAYRLKNAAHQIVSDLRLARARSVATNRQFRIRFDPLSDSYLLEKGDSSTGSASWSVEGSVRYFGEHADPLYSGVGIEGDAAYSFVFRPTGGVTAGTVTLRNAKGQEMQVVCSMAGRIRLERE